jgi:hypothetical protein
MLKMYTIETTKFGKSLNLETSEPIGAVLIATMDCSAPCEMSRRSFPLP